MMSVWEMYRIVNSPRKASMRQVLVKGAEAMRKLAVLAERTFDAVDRMAEGRDRAPSTSAECTL
jgi:hypothetical protein